MPYDAESAPKSPVAPVYQKRARALAATLRSLPEGAYCWLDPSSCVIGWAYRRRPEGWRERLFGREPPRQWLGMTRNEFDDLYTGRFGYVCCKTKERAAAVLEQWADTGVLSPARL